MMCTTLVRARTPEKAGTLRVGTLGLIADVIYMNNTARLEDLHDAMEVMMSSNSVYVRESYTCERCCSL